MRRNERRKAANREDKIVAEYEQRLKTAQKIIRTKNNESKLIRDMTEKIGRIKSAHARKNLLDQVTSPEKVKQ